jgi:hypothetical protein
MSHTCSHIQINLIETPKHKVVTVQLCAEVNSTIVLLASERLNSIFEKKTKIKIKTKA